MDRKLTFVSAAAVALILSGWTKAAPDFSYGVEGCREKVTGAPGSTQQIEFFGTLTTANNTSPDGPQGWSVSLSVEGANIVSNLLKGVEVSTIFFDDLDDSTDTTDDIERKDPYIQDLGSADMFTKVIARATLPADPNRKGIISAIVMKSQEKQVLQPNGTSRMFRLVVEATVPAEGCIPVTLKYENGFKSTQSQPTPNVVTFSVDNKPTSFPPNLGTCTVMVCAPPPVQREFQLAAVAAGANPSPGDADNELVKNVPPGENTVDVEVVLTTANLNPGDGPQGWSLSVRNDPCLTVDKPLLKGVEVSTIFYDDLDDSTDTTDDIVKKDPYIQDLGAADMFTKVVAKATGADPSPLPDEAQGVISAVIMKSQEKQVLHANSSDRILRVSYKINVVENETTNCRVFFENGLKSTQSQPTPNVITYSPADVVMSFPPTKQQGLLVKLTGKKEDVSDSFVRGDPNDDGKSDIADAVAIVLNVVPGLRGPNDVEITCKEAGNVNGDGGMNLVDAIYLIDWQFRGSQKPPVAPYPACATVAGVPPSECPPNSFSCQ